MNQLAKVSNKDKLFIASSVIGIIVMMFFQNPDGVLLGYAMLGLWLLDKVWETLLTISNKLDIIEEEKEKLSVSLIPDTPYESELNYDAPSINRLLGAIKVNDDQTLFDYVVDNSNNENVSLRLVQVTDKILSSLSNYEIINGNQASDNRTNQSTGIK